LPGTVPTAGGLLSGSAAAPAEPPLLPRERIGRDFVGRATGEEASANAHPGAGRPAGDWLARAKDYIGKMMP
jgi:hypothetical protein